MLIPEIIKMKIVIVAMVVMATVTACSVFAVKVQTDRLRAVQSEYATFKGGVTALAEAARVRANEINEQNRQNMERANERYSRLDADLRATRERLRIATSTRGSFVPEAARDSGGPIRACYDGAELDGALRSFAEAVEGIAGEGQKAVNGLNTAKEWARGNH